MSESSPQTENNSDSTDEESSGEQSGGGAESNSVGISDDQLPEDLQPTDDNPLAKPPSDDEDDSGMSLGPDGPGAEAAPPG